MGGARPGPPRRLPNNRAHGSPGREQLIVCKGRDRRSKEPPRRTATKKTGGVLLSQAVAHQVPSALRGLTALFGMGRGVSPSLWPPKSRGTEGAGAAREAAPETIRPRRGLK